MNFGEGYLKCKTKCKEMDIYVEKKNYILKRKLCQEKQQKILILHYLEKSKQQCWMSHFLRELGTCSKVMDQVMYVFTIIQPFFMIFQRDT